MSHNFSFFPDLCCPPALLPISQGCCWCFHISFWSKAGSSRLFSAFAPDSALHTSSLLEGIISCSAAASDEAFHHLLCQSATGVLKDTGSALEKRWTQKGTQPKCEFGDLENGVSSATAGTEGHGMDEALLTWFAGCW